MSDFRIAVVGVSGRFPNAKNVEALWENICAGQNGSTHFTSEDLSKGGVSKDEFENSNYVPVRGVVADTENFDYAFFGYSLKEAELIDPQQRFFLECAWTALEDAGYLPNQIKVPVGVYAGQSMTSYLSSLDLNSEYFDGDFMAQIGSQSDFLATRVSYKLGLTGPSMTVQTGCSTSLTAVHLACQSLLTRECDIALAGGSSIRFPQNRGYIYSEGGVYSPDGKCRAFDIQANGVFSGNGTAVVVLKRFDDALRDGDPIRAVILATSVNNDGSLKMGFTAPSEMGQAEGMAAALSLAGVSADDIGFVEAHGTGTKLGDPIEVAGLTRAFRKSSSRQGYCAIGSIKTNIGHLDAAAGVSGLIKTILVLERGLIPPTLNFTEPNPALNLESSPFYVNSKIQEWKTDRRIAAVNSFGIGGTNAHVVIESYQTPSRAEVEPPGFFGYSILPLSSKTEAGLDSIASDLLQAVSRTPAPRLDDLVHTMQTRQISFEHRAAALFTDQQNLVEILKEHKPNHWLKGEQSAKQLCFLFPGGGAQYFPMALDLYEADLFFRQQIDDCAAIIQKEYSVDIRKYLFSESNSLSLSPDERLGFAIPLASLFIVEYALAKALMAREIVPTGGMIGHSLGEYVAATLAEVFTLTAALKLVIQRGVLLARCPAGAMLSVRASPSQLTKIPSGTGIAAKNAPEVTTVSGTVNGIEKLELELTAQEIEYRKIPLATAAHSYLLDGVLDEYRAALTLTVLKKPKIKFISNVSGTWITDAQATSVEYWVCQLRQPVEFQQGLTELAASGPAVFFEVGPGRILSSIVRANELLKNGVVSVHSMRSQGEAIADRVCLGGAVAKLWISGINLDWSKINGVKNARVTSLPGYAFAKTRCWLRPDLVREKQSDLTNWFSAPVWRQDVQALPKLNDNSIFCLVIGSAKRLEEVEPLLKQLPGRYRFCKETDLLLTDCKVSQIVFLTEPNATIDENTAALLRLRNFLKFLNDVSDTVFLTIVVSGVALVGPQDFIDPRVAPFVAAMKVIPQEHLGVKTVLCDARPQTLEDWRNALSFIFAKTAPQMFAIRPHGCFVADFSPLHLSSSTHIQRQIKTGGVYLITGGLGKVGRHLAAHLAKTYQARIVLTGRSASFENIDFGSGEVLCLTADSSNLEQMHSVITSTIKKFGHIDGVLHAAGITSGFTMQTLFSHLSHDDFTEQYRAKVNGTEILFKLLKDIPLDFILLFSSNASPLGGLGLLAYSAANQFMDLFATQMWSQGDRRWLTATWDGWRVENEAARSRTTSLEQFAMQPHESLKLFDLVVQCSPVPTIFVSRKDIRQRADLWLNNKLDREVVTVESESSRKLIEPKDEVERALLTIWQELLGRDEISTDDIFFDLGGHSLFATRMLARIRERLHVEFPLFRLFENPRISGMAEIIRDLPKIQNDVVITKRKSLTLKEILASRNHP